MDNNKLTTNYDLYLAVAFILDLDVKFDRGTFNWLYEDLTMVELARAIVDTESVPFGQEIELEDKVLKYLESLENEWVFTA